MPKVKARKNIVLRHKCVFGESQWDENIFVPFVPDEVSIKYVVYWQSGLANVLSIDGYVPANQPAVGAPIPIPSVSASGVVTPSFLWSDLVNEYIAPIIDVEQYQTPNTVWQLQRFVSGAYTFKTVYINGNPDTVREGWLMIHLEFVQYD